MDFLSPDGSIGSPLQAAGLLITAFVGAIILARGLVSQTRTAGPGGLVSSLWRYDSAVALSLAALAVLNLVHNFTPLTGVFRP